MLSVTLAVAMLFVTTTTAFAAGSDTNSFLTQNKAEIEQALQDIVEYSTYDSATGTWVLDYSIVEDGIFTERQYQDAEKAADIWYQYSEGQPTTRALPAALVLVLKAIGAIAGTAVVTKITEEIYTWGMSTACENWQSIDLFKDYCEANGYL